MLFLLDLLVIQPRLISDYTDILRSALFRGGLTSETLDALISGENEYSNAEANVSKGWDDTYTKPDSVPITMPVLQSSAMSPDISSTAAGEGFLPKPSSYHLNRTHSFGQLDSVDTPPERDEHFSPDAADSTLSRPPFPRDDQRTVLFTNLSDHTTHQDLVNIIRGGRLLDIYIRNDRSATVSFVEGAQEFLSYAKRNDFYIHAKRVRFIAFGSPLSTLLIAYRSKCAGTIANSTFPTMLLTKYLSVRLVT